MSDSTPPPIATILFVEDEKNMLQLFKKVFTEKGFKVLTASNGIQGLEILMNLQPDLIVSDIMMPEMDGIEFFKEVQERFGEKRPEFLFLTAKTDEDDVVNGLSLGVEDYITKPVSIRQLAAKISTLVKRMKSQEKSMSAGLIGNLKDQSVADILQYLELANHTGRLMISIKNKSAEIQLNEGNVVWADFPPLSGINAVYAVLALEEGTFQFEITDDIIKTNRINTDNYAIILEGMRQIDENGRDALLAPVFSNDVSLITSMTSEATDSPDFKETTDPPVSIETIPDHIDQPEIPLTIPAWHQPATYTTLKQICAELEPGSFAKSEISEKELRTFIEDNSDQTMILMMGNENQIQFICDTLMDFNIAISNETIPKLDLIRSGKKILQIIGITKEHHDFPSNLTQQLPCILFSDDIDSIISISKSGRVSGLTVWTGEPDSLEEMLSADPVCMEMARVIPYKHQTMLAVLISLKKTFQIFEDLSGRSGLETGK